jgi:hypothetical protein
MVRKEIWAHLLAYNLLRTVMAVAAAQSEVEPRKISFKGTKQAVAAFAPKIEAARPEDRGRLIDALRKTVASHRVGNRPGRWEPRATRRRPKHAMRLMQPRAVAKRPQNRSKYFSASAIRHIDRPRLHSCSQLRFVGRRALGQPGPARCRSQCISMPLASG